jgi:hypothetical protein
MKKKRFRPKKSRPQLLLTIDAAQLINDALADFEAVLTVKKNTVNISTATQTLYQVKQKVASMLADKTVSVEVAFTENEIVIITAAIQIYTLNQMPLTPELERLLFHVNQQMPGSGRRIHD